MMRIKLMADYGCWPLWHDADGEVGNIDPRSLPISEALIIDLHEWAAKLDSSLDWDDPANSEWPEGFLGEFEGQRRTLAERLQAELGSGYEVTSKSHS